VSYTVNRLSEVTYLEMFQGLEEKKKKKELRREKREK